jgi:fatty acid desaturase
VPDVRLKITTYQKPHHQYMYIPYHSFPQAWSFQTGFIEAELQRYAAPTPYYLQIFCT